jgi:hypothetical protein
MYKLGNVNNVIHTENPAMEMQSVFFAPQHYVSLSTVLLRLFHVAERNKM